jgi:transposase-like protein
MELIKYDFNSCYETPDFAQYDYEQIIPDFESNSLQDGIEDILNTLLDHCEIEPPQPKFVRFPDPIKLLTTIKNKVRKNLSITPKSIIFNKTNMANHPDIETNIAQIFKSVFDMGKGLNSEKACREHLEQLRWNGEPICPHCGSQRENHYRILTRGEDKGRYKCKDCRLPFSVTIGTIFEKSTVPLEKWFRAVFLFTSNKKGLSSYQLMREIGVTQKRAWFMLSRLRNSVRTRVDFEFDGIIT